jgi:dihydrofolate reductase
MRISVIAAIDRNGLIGNERGLPWHLPRDLRRFRDLTLGKPIIMGRTTHEHIGRPLPGRRNIVLTRKKGASIPGCSVASSLDEALQLAGEAAEEVFAIGGAELYRIALPRADRLYLTIVDGVFQGKTYFPRESLHLHCWIVKSHTLSEPDGKNVHRDLFVQLERQDPPGQTDECFDLSATLAAPFAASKWE